MSKSFSPFNRPKKHRELFEAINAEVRAAAEARREFAISGENVMVYRHGRNWSLQQSANPDEVSKFAEASMEVTIRGSDIIDHNISSIDNYVVDLANGHQKLMFQSVISLADKATAQTGNVVLSGPNVGASMLEALRKIRFGTDRYGRPTGPTLVVHPTMAKKLQEMESKQTQQEIDEWQITTAFKEAEATSDEVERIRRFRWTP
ncbi:hypothetical protein NKI77_00080 [Mesorhizobium opportunistum]|uniref:Uncharacterized protein n=1 Tax=Mesorhizobium opportunistum TaxID=593909 RepID=A0ABV1YEI4_9HYPH|nr:hypothetical protein [Mesorhizobium sp.]TIN93733.1 MAG: hypothetical protein E5Y06_18005 [Mesorhizobium sp.]TJU99800.1 MAG: hypothetical protein E5Y08_09075 [Mesorhizobium sp.]TJV13314.1 MAG: hypothetical protein E5Y07_32190 [Mesorhizobium sp.]